MTHPPTDRSPLFTICHLLPVDGCRSTRLIVSPKSIRSYWISPPSIFTVSSVRIRGTLCSSISLRSRSIIRSFCRSGLVTTNWCPSVMTHRHATGQSLRAQRDLNAAISSGAIASIIRSCDSFDHVARLLKLRSAMGI